MRASGDVGFCWFVYHVSGTLQTGEEIDMWVRATLGCQRIDDEWQMVHDHESVRPIVHGTVARSKGLPHPPEWNDRCGIVCISSASRCSESARVGRTSG